MRLLHELIVGTKTILLSGLKKVKITANQSWKLCGDWKSSVQEQTGPQYKSQPALLREADRPNPPPLEVKDAGSFDSAFPKEGENMVTYQLRMVPGGIFRQEQCNASLQGAPRLHNSLTLAKPCWNTCPVLVAPAQECAENCSHNAAERTPGRQTLKFSADRFARNRYMGWLDCIKDLSL